MLLPRLFVRSTKHVVDGENDDNLNNTKRFFVKITTLSGLQNAFSSTHLTHSRRPMRTLPFRVLQIERSHWAAAVPRDVSIRATFKSFRGGDAHEYSASRRRKSAAARSIAGHRDAEA